MSTELNIERILVAVEQVPRTRVTTYGDLAKIVPSSARRVGRVLRDHGDAVAWWRVTNASGELPEPLRERARVLWAEEGIAWARTGRGCVIDAHRVELGWLAEAYERAMAEVLQRAGLALPQLPAAAISALEELGVRSLEELCEHRRSKISDLVELGPAQLDELDRAVRRAGLHWPA